ncbi:hypothetical protein CHLRE_03g164400v5 [Chlamydomonas reinhardtii]|uniref:Uncharacterized protein n=1 Tax=Chlamydomonas reinhardtii TaxID=3055 RepID=A0A2K3DWL1_CHLRE|nr:uncharacterized protein CHLRE_03g164400v5 [Chlamydomonas reinhardtii]PNW84927.1 hypothetical protein CHLRE_03g164400v5 [Chlamydomonas reinhardtii]
MTQSVASSCCDIPQLPAAAPTPGGAPPAAAAQPRAPRARFSIRAEETSNALPCEDEDEVADELVSWRLRLQRQRQLLPERRRQQQVLEAYRSRRHMEEQAHLQLQQLLREASTGSAGSAAQRAGASAGAGSDDKETGQEVALAPTELQRLLGPLMPPAGTVEDWRVLLCSWEEVVATAARRSSPADGGGSGGNDSPGGGGGGDAVSAAAEWPVG